MSNYICKFCGTMFKKQNDLTYYAHAIEEGAHVYLTSTYMSHKMVSSYSLNKKSDREQMDTAVSVHYYVCPSCNETSIELHTEGVSLTKSVIPIHPKSNALQLPSYIPDTIREDYNEACLISHLSPKASATLSRRVLQFMIRDFFNIKDKRTLHEEIMAIKSNISESELNALLSLKSIGNIGAHPDKNEDINMILEINPSEAEILIRLIEHFIKSWYVERESKNKLLNDIVKLKDSFPSPTK